MAGTGSVAGEAGAIGWNQGLYSLLLCGRDLSNTGYSFHPIAILYWGRHLEVYFTMGEVYCTSAYQFNSAVYDIFDINIQNPLVTGGF